MHQPVSSLNLPDFKIHELEAAGYHYVQDVDITKIQLNPDEWTDITKIVKTKSALDIYEEECISRGIPTFNKDLDNALGTGIPIGLITEFCGEPGTGKTQICFQLCVNIQLPKWCDGSAGEAVYITTNKGFASHRLKEIATAYVENYISFKSSMLHRDPNNDHDDNFNVDSIMERIHCMDVDDHTELIAAVKYLKKWLKDHTDLHLLVIDTISAPLKLLNGQERTQLIYSLLSDLQKLAQEYKFAIVLTNDMTTRISSPSTGYITPSLGDSYYHRINIRVQLTRLANNTFKASILKNPLKPSSEIIFSFPC